MASSRSLWYSLLVSVCDGAMTIDSPATGLQTHNKEKLFKEWGYTVDDARWLQAEIERQGRERYLSGQYELGKLNMFGQRINIRVTIPRKDGFGDISFVTGWMVKPNGQIKLNTPYGGK